MKRLVVAGCAVLLATAGAAGSGGGDEARGTLSTEDAGAKLKACQTMMCSDGGISEGMTVDFDAGRRLNYWFVANGQLVQYSGTADPASAKLTTDAADRLAGTLNLHGCTSGGPLVQVEFDARLVKEVKK